MSFLLHFRQPRKLRRSCDFCTASKLKCSQEKPACERCIRSGRGETCTYSAARPPGRPKRPSTVDFDSITRHARQHSDQMSFHGPEASSSSTYDACMQLVDGNDAYNNGVSGATTCLKDPFAINALGEVEVRESDAPVDNIFDFGVSFPEFGKLSDDQTGSDFDFDFADFGTTWEPTLPPDSSPTCPTANSEQTAIGTPGSLASDIFGTSDQSTAGSGAPEQKPYEVHSPVDDDCQWLQSMNAITSSLTVFLSPNQPRQLDSLFTAEQALISMKQSISPGSSSSPELIVLSLMSLLPDRLKAYFVEIDGVDNGASSLPALHVGNITIPDDVAMTCVRAMAKRRLRSHIQAFGKTAGLCGESKEVLASAVQQATSAVVREAEGLLGMLNLRGVGVQA